MSFHTRSNTSCRVLSDKCWNRSFSVEDGGGCAPRVAREARAGEAVVRVSAKISARPNFKTVVDERGPCIEFSGPPAGWIIKSCGDFRTPNPRHAWMPAPYVQQAGQSSPSGSRRLTGL